MRLHWMMIYQLTNDIAFLRGIAPKTEKDIVNLVHYNMDKVREKMTGETKA